MHPGRAVQADELIDELWDGEPPDGAGVTLRSYVSRLRSALGPAAPIENANAAYVLDVGAQAIDAHRFQALVREADAALDDRRYRRALNLLQLALGMWRGAPYADLEPDGALRIEAERLADLRLHAVERRVEAELALGAAPELVNELESLVQQHPYRESLWRQLMLSLYRSGRQADALAAYHRARRLLDEHLGIEPGAALQALEGAILRQEVEVPPPARDRHNLPEPLSSFVGREAEVDGLRRLLGEARLVTLTGVGGVGKTRLALEVARRQLSEWSDGVVFVDLSSSTEPAHVGRQLAQALEVREQPGTRFVEGVTAHLLDRELLLLLDNCEHLAEATAEVVHTILTRCPRVQILATSRELLGCPGEVDVPVSPLPLPEGGASSAEARASDAVGLFMARAREARHGLIDDPATIARAADICRDLDGLPLAIELAAARAKTLSLEAIADGVRQRFQFLVSWRRLSAARHRTLRQAIDWSFDLLGPAEQQLLARLSVFAGGCTLPAIAAVCLDGDAEAATRLLERLVASSLVNPIHGHGETRYRMLETVREYAAEHLATRGETDAVRRAHALYFRSVVDAAWAPLRLGEATAWTDRFAAEHDNLRAALTWADQTGEPEELLRLAEGLWYFWWIHGDLSEGRGWLARALEAVERAPGGIEGGLDPVLLGRALAGAARLAWAAADFEPARDLAERAWTLLRDHAGALDQGLVLQTLGVVSTARQDLPAARAWLEQARARFESLAEDDPWRRDRLAGVLIVLGSVDFFEGDYGRAAERYLAARTDCVARDDLTGVALCDLYLAHVRLLEQRLDESLDLARRALGQYHQVGWLQYVAECFEIIAFANQAAGNAVDAVRLVGAADALRDRTGNPATLALARLREERLPLLREALGEEAYAAELAAGRSMTSEQSLAVGLGDGS